MNRDKTSRLQDFKENKRVESIQKYANRNHDGNFTKAANELIDMGLKAGKNQEKK